MRCNLFVLNDIRATSARRLLLTKTHKAGFKDTIVNEELDLV